MTRAIARLRTTTTRPLRGARRLVIALAMILTACAGLSAHRRDEYLQAARVAIDPAGVRLELDLTPGIALAGAIIADIDRNRDGSLSADEQRAYAGQVVSALTLEVDGSAIQAQLRTATFPALDAMRLGEGIIRLQVAATLPALAPGGHQLLFRNRHHPNASVYLANALVPGNDDVAVTAQRRDGDQTQLTIEYVLRGRSQRSNDRWLVGGLAAAMVLGVVWVWRARASRAAVR